MPKICEKHLEMLQEIARKRATTFHVSGIDPEDMEQEIIARILKKFPKISGDDRAVYSYLEIAAKGYSINIARDMHQISPGPFKYRKSEFDGTAYRNSFPVGVQAGDGSTEKIEDGKKAKNSLRVISNSAWVEGAASKICNEDADLSIDIRDAVLSLPPRLRRIVKMFQRGLSQKEISEQMKMHRNTLDAKIIEIRKIFSERGLGDF